MIVSGNLYLHKSEFKDYVTAERFLTLENPAYTQQARYTNYIDPNIPQVLTFINQGRYYSIPRNFTEVLLDPRKIIDRTTNGKPLDGSLDFVGQLWKYQEDYLTTIPETETDFIINAPCGHGKTCLALYLACVRYKRKMLIMVPDHFLAQQWEDAVKEYIPEALYGRIQPGKRLEYRGKDIFIVNFDQLNVRDLDSAFYEYWGVTLLDEAHSLGATSYYPLLEKLPARIRIALTATFRRNDGMHQILRFNFGNIFPMKRQFPASKIYQVTTNIVVKTLIHTGTVCKAKKFATYVGGFVTLVEDSPAYIDTAGPIINISTKKALEDFIRSAHHNKVITDKQQEAYLYFLRRVTEEPPIANIETYLAMHPTRSAAIVRMLTRLIDSGRKIIFLSKRKEALINFEKIMRDKGYSTALIVSGAAKDEKIVRKVKDGVDVLFGITQLARQGLDSPTSDTLVLHLPIKDIEQPIGRIERVRPGKNHPVALQLVDEHQYCKAITKASAQFSPLSIQKGSFNMRSLLTLIPSL